MSAMNDMCDENDRLKERIAELERVNEELEREAKQVIDIELAAIEARCMALIDPLKQNLAAAQATIQQMREYIGKAPHRPVCYRLDIYDERDHGCTCGREKLLALPNDCTALDAMLADARKDYVLLDFFERNPSCELSRDADDRESEPQWKVQKVTGWPNDREWEVIGQGETVRNAIRQAAERSE